MKKPSKIIVFLITAVLLLGTVGTLAACTDPKADFHVDVFYYQYTDAFISTVRSELEARLGSIDHTNYDAGNSQVTQTAQLEQAIAKGSNLLIVNIVDTGAKTTVESFVKKAKDANIPIVFFNREPDNSVFSSDDWAKKNTAFVGTNYVQAGYLQGELIASYLMKNEDSAGKCKFDVDNDKKIKYIAMRGEMANNEAIARTLYSVLTANYLLKKANKDYVLEASDLNIANETNPVYPSTWKFQYDGLDIELSKAATDYNNGVNPLQRYCVDSEGTWDSGKATSMMDTIKSVDPSCFTNGRFEIAICNNDNMAQGVIKSLQADNYNKTADGKLIPVFGVDGTTTAREYIEQGSMAGTIEQSNISMAQMLSLILGNVQAKAATLTECGTLELVRDGVAKNLIRIPYGVVTK